ncbi:hypothetical protein GCM10010211_42240 [Streptomyces albospinus]|uniref:Uncharacterized protein n=1 Tax=Streptomyces albospinus TaxID=285515 RepID=A0ABQ2V9I1_9ACTN|nr:DUF6336 family protein [Streptomyces albospinus]GGU71962.1 hypothetical protein GCM10010211_42240 [Streptomyces albospinus]
MAAAAEEEGVIMPRLRFRDVVPHGALYGAAATLIPAVASVTAGPTHGMNTAPRSSAPSPS